jgi:uncharacterized protein YcbK (DUF882 family)
MISLEELNKHHYATTPEIDSNLALLLERLNKVRMVYNQLMSVTSGLRSTEQQNSLIAQGKSNAPHSKHLTGQAADIYDPSGLLKRWIKDNIALIETIGLWMEDFSFTPNWVHFQSVPPLSGNRFFIP